MTVISFITNDSSDDFLAVDLGLNSRIAMGLPICDCLRDTSALFMK